MFLRLFSGCRRLIITPPRHAIFFDMSAFAAAIVYAALSQARDTLSSFRRFSLPFRFRYFLRYIFR